MKGISLILLFVCYVFFVSSKIVPGEEQKAHHVDKKRLLKVYGSDLKYSAASDLKFNQNSKFNEINALQSNTKLYSGRLKRESGSYPGYRETANIGVIPPRRTTNSDRRNRAIDNSGTVNQIPQISDVKVRNDSFGNNAYENVLIGLYIWNFLSKLNDNDNYDLYHYYNKPDNISEVIKIQTTDIIMCPMSTSTMCVAGSRRICTVNGVVYCGVSSYGVPTENDSIIEDCLGNDKQQCANVQMPCSDEQRCESLQIPCLSSLIVEMNMIEINIKYCIISYSVPKPTSENYSLRYKSNSYQSYNRYY